jgi:signal transduction histidine kinase
MLKLTPLRIRRFFSTIRGRLIALLTLLFGASLIVVAGISYQIFALSQQSDFDAALYNHAVDVGATLGEGLVDPFSFSPFSLGYEEKKNPFPLRRSFVQLRHLDGTLMAKSANMGAAILPLNPRELALLVNQDVLFYTLSAQSLPNTRGAPTKQFRVVNYLVRRTGVPILILQIAAPMTGLEQSQNQLFNLFLVLIPLVLFLSAFGGYTFTAKAFEPIRKMIQRTADIQIKNLNVRVDVPEMDPELQELATTLNALLSRVEQAVHLQERFIADASHQLKTPLAIVQGELEILLRDSTQSTQNHDYLQSIQSEIKQLIQLVENLLLLAKMDAGHGILLFQKVRMDEVILEVVARLSKLAGNREIRLQPELIPFSEQKENIVDFEVAGDPDLLRSLIFTLLENAIKYSPEKTQVSVRLKETAETLILEVHDQGDGIAPEDLPNVFERFVRSPKQTLKTGGAGLGLAIAKRITEIHRGTIEVNSTPGKGSVFHIEIKKF